MLKICIYTYWEINSAKIYAIKFLFKQRVPGNQKSKRCFSHVEKKKWYVQSEATGAYDFRAKILASYMSLQLAVPSLKVARYSFSGPIPPKFEHKVRRHKQRFGKIATTVVLDKNENLLRSGLQRHRSCHSNEMTLLPFLLAAVYLGNGNCSSKIVHGSFFPQ